MLLDAVVEDEYLERREMLVQLLYNMESSFGWDSLGVASMSIPVSSGASEGRFEMISLVRLAITLVAFEPASQRAVQVMRFLAVIFPNLFHNFPNHGHDLSEIVDQFVRLIVGGQLENAM